MERTKHRQRRRVFSVCWPMAFISGAIVIVFWWTGH
jgi:hypothetical protein